MTTPFLKILFVLAACSSAAVGADRSTRPHIVFVLVDDLRWDDLGCTGHPFGGEK